MPLLSRVLGLSENRLQTFYLKNNERKSLKKYELHAFLIIVLRSFSSTLNGADDNDDNDAVTTNDDNNAVTTDDDTASATIAIGMADINDTNRQIDEDVRKVDGGERFASCSSSSADDEHGGADIDISQRTADTGKATRSDMKKSIKAADTTTSPPPDVIMHHNNNNVKRSKRNRRRRRSFTATATTVVNGDKNGDGRAAKVANDDVDSDMCTAINDRDKCDDNGDNDNDDDDDDNDHDDDNDNNIDNNDDDDSRSIARTLQIQQVSIVGSSVRYGTVNGFYSMP